MSYTNVQMRGRGDVEQPTRTVSFFCYKINTYKTTYIISDYTCACRCPL